VVVGARLGYPSEEIDVVSRLVRHHLLLADIASRRDLEDGATIDSVAAFVQRIQEGKPENTGVRGAESSLTAILGRMAMDRRREVSWDEMMRS